MTDPIVEARLAVPAELLEAAGKVDEGGLTPAQAVELALGIQIRTWCLEAAVSGIDEADYIARRLAYVGRQVERRRLRDEEDFAAIRRRMAEVEVEAGEGLTLEGVRERLGLPRRGAADG